MDASVFIGAPLYYKETIPIRIPLTKEVIGMPKYDSYYSIFSFFQEDIWDMINEKEGRGQSGEQVTNAPTPFEFFLLNCLDENFMKVAEEAFLFWTGSPVRIIPQTQIILFVNSLAEAKEAKELATIENDDDFFIFQNLVLKATGGTCREKPNLNEDPSVSRIKAKGRYREKIKKKKGKKNAIPFDRMLVAICCMGIGITPLNIGEIPYAAISDLFGLWQDKEKYETDLKVATAGFGNPKIKPVYWITANK